MEKSNIAHINQNNTLDIALLNFGIYNAVPARFTKALVKRGDIIIAQKFFSEVIDFIDFAELTPSGMLKWDDLQHHDILKSIGEFEKENATSDVGDPTLVNADERFLFSIERIQRFISEDKTEELFKMMNKEPIS